MARATLSNTLLDEETCYLDTPATLVRVQSTQAEKNMRREMYAAWSWNLQIPVFDSSRCRTANKKELNDKKFLSEE